MKFPGEGTGCREEPAGAVTVIISISVTYIAESGVWEGVTEGSVELAGTVA